MSVEFTESFPLNHSQSSALPRHEIVLVIVASLLVIALMGSGRFGLTWLETMAFVTGGICVWLTVRENIWNWPIGITNSIIFGLVFWNSRLFADMSLQGVYVVLGFLGWYWWLRGGEKHTRLRVRRTPLWELLAVFVVVAVCTYAMEIYLRSINDAAPFWDALTTMLSLGAQYLLTRKFIENWGFWIAADLIYIPLYWSRGLVLTGILYCVFLLLCLAGVRQWQRSLREQA